MIQHSNDLKSQSSNNPLANNLKTKGFHTLNIPISQEIKKQTVEKDTLNETRYGCDQCTFRVKFKRHLISHRGKEHPNLKVQCEECGYMGTEAGLKQHMIKHKGEINACDQCDYRTP